jgi:hypothetical protein
LFDAYAHALSRQPWLREWPATLHDVLPVLLPAGQVALQHPASGVQLPLRAGADLGWHLLAVSGGHPLTLFGEWNGRALLPLTHWSAPSAAVIASDL